MNHYEYMQELAAEIVANGNPNGDIREEMKAAHERRQAFALEMAEGVTPRSRRARAAIKFALHESSRRRNASAQFAASLEGIEA